MKPNRTSYENSKRYVIVCLVMSVVCCVVALLAGSNTATGNTLLILAIVFIAAAVFLAVVLLKCPYCGTRIFRNCLVVKVCPHCRRELISGRKVKNKKIR